MVNNNLQDNSWDQKTERRQYEFYTMKRIVEEHKENPWPTQDDSVYSEETSCCIVDLFRKILGCKDAD